MYRLLAALRPQWASSTDAVLLRRFHTERDEAAFAELVRRYGPLVWGVCRRGLTNPADAEDAFQATFLVLVRRVHDVANHPALGAWLHRVALHTVRNVRRLNRRRTTRVGPLTTDASTPDPIPIADARLDVDTALSRLPDRLRVPVVLCHLQGLTRSEAAARLGCPEGTLSANLAEALRRLRHRLAHPDVQSVLAIAGATLVPTGLASAAARAAIIYSTSTTLAAGVSPTVVILTEGVLRMFWLKKLVTAVAVVVLGIGVTVGVGYRVGNAGPDEPAKATPVPKAKEVTAKPINLGDLEIKMVSALVKQYGLVQEHSFNLWTLRGQDGQILLDAMLMKAKRDDEAYRVVMMKLEQNVLQRQQLDQKQQAALQTLVLECDAIVKQLNDEIEAARLDANAEFRKQALRSQAIMKSRIKHIELKCQLDVGKSDWHVGIRRQGYIEQVLTERRAELTAALKMAANAEEKALLQEKAIKLAESVLRIQADQEQARANQLKLDMLVAKLRIDTAKAEDASDNLRNPTRLVIDVNGKPSAVQLADFQVSEWKNGVGHTVHIRTAESLERFLARSKADPNAAKNLRIRVDPDTDISLAIGCLFACRDAGFKTARYDGPMTQELSVVIPDPKNYVASYPRHGGEINLAALSSFSRVAPKP